MGNIQHRFDKFEVSMVKILPPRISDQAIIAKIDYWHKSGLKLNKIPENRRDYSFQNKKEAFNELFDISTCDCFDKGIDGSAFRCKLKIPLIEWKDYVQNNSRKFVPLTSYLNCKPFTIRSIRSTRVFTSCTSANSFACIYNVLSFGNYILFGFVDGILLYEWNCCTTKIENRVFLSGIDIHETKRIRERALRNETGYRIEEIENELANEVEIDHGIDTNETIEEPMDEDSTYTCIKRFFIKHRENKCTTRESAHTTYYELIKIWD